MIAVGRDEHLRLVAKAAEGDRMNDPVAVALEDVARTARAGVDFRMGPAARAGMAARQESKSFGGQFPDRLAGLAGPGKGVNADAMQGPRRRYSASCAVPERTDQQSRPSGLLGDIAADAFEQVAVARLDPVELRREARWGSGRLQAGSRACASCRDRIRLRWRRDRRQRDGGHLLRSRLLTPLPAQVRGTALRIRLRRLRQPAARSNRSGPVLGRLRRRWEPLDDLVTGDRDGRPYGELAFRANAGKMPRLTAAAFWSDLSAGSFRKKWRHVRATSRASPRRSRSGAVRCRRSAQGPRPGVRAPAASPRAISGDEHVTSASVFLPGDGEAERKPPPRLVAVASPTSAAR